MPPFQKCQYNAASIFTTITATCEIGFGTCGVRGVVADMSDELRSAYTSAFLQAVASKEKIIIWL